MKFMVEFRLSPGSRNKVMEAFEAIGPNRNPGVKFHGAWIGIRSDVIFVLAESAEESLVSKAGQGWREHGDFLIHPVVDAEQF